jgi:hypothetical protein
MSEIGTGELQVSEVIHESSGSLWVAVWAYLGVILLLVQSILRLIPVALEPLLAGVLSTFQHVVFWGWIVASIYLEGYRGFHLRFVPRVRRRVGLLMNEPTRVRVILAPLYVMGFFDAPRADKRAAWGVTLAVLCAVFVVRTLGQPWRGIIDGGVVAGLGAGLVSLCMSALSPAKAESVENAGKIAGK